MGEYREIATATVGPASSPTTEVSTELEIKLSLEKLHNLLDYCSTPRSSKQKYIKA